MKEIKVSTKYSSTVRIKTVTFVMSLKEPNMLQVYCCAGKFLYIPVNNDKEEFIFEFDEADLWKAYLKRKKEIMKSNKNGKEK